jgi:hypothetical protein
MGGMNNNIRKEVRTMPSGFKSTDQRARRIIAAWETLRPNKSFGGMTLADFKAQVQPTFETRVTLANLESQITAARDQRDDADRETERLIGRVVNGVRADPDEGEDGELYEAMGYKRRSERQSGLTRKRATTTTSPTNG